MTETRDSKWKAEGIPFKSGFAIMAERKKEHDALRAENQRLKEALNAINNLAVGWQETGGWTVVAWDTIDDIYKLSLLPEKAE
jgi:hypothetical protein